MLSTFLFFIFMAADTWFIMWTAIAWQLTLHIWRWKQMLERNDVRNLPLLSISPHAHISLPFRTAPHWIDVKHSCFFIYFIFFYNSRYVPPCPTAFGLEPKGHSIFNSPELIPKHDQSKKLSHHVQIPPLMWITKHILFNGQRPISPNSEWWAWLGYNFYMINPVLYMV